MLNCILDFVTFNAVYFIFLIMNLNLYISYFSPLQICGLIFFSRKHKKERRGSQKKEINQWMIHMIKVLILILLLHPLPIRALALEQHQLTHPLIKTSVLTLVGTLNIPNKLVQSSQQFPLHHQIVKLLVQDFLDTKYTFFSM